MNEYLARFVLGLVALIIAVLCNGYVVMTMWGWFVAPTFELELLSFSESVVLSMFVTYCTNTPTHIKDDFKEDFSVQLISAITRPLITIAFAYLYLIIFF